MNFKQNRSIPWHWQCNLFTYCVPYITACNYFVETFILKIYWLALNSFVILTTFIVSQDRYMQRTYSSAEHSTVYINLLLLDVTSFVSCTTIQIQLTSHCFWIHLHMGRVLLCMPVTFPQRFNVFRLNIRNKKMWFYCRRRTRRPNNSIRVSTHCCSLARDLVQTELIKKIEKPHAESDFL